MTYKILKVSSQARDFETKFGPMRSYRVMFDGQEQPVEITQKTTTPPPTVGQTLEGEIEESQYGLKLKKSHFQAPQHRSDDHQMIITRNAMINSSIAFHGLLGDKPSITSIVSDAQFFLKWVKEEVLPEPADEDLPFAETNQDPVELPF